jgi:hypothetical protein
MPSDVSLVDVRKSFQAVAGLESMTEMDNFFFEQSLNRAVRRAYDQSPSWPRYLVVSEERDIISIQISGVTGTSATDINSNYSFLGTVESTYSGTVLNKSTKVYLSKDSATVPTVGNTDITNATIIYQQMKQSSSDDIRWIVRTGATVSYDIQTDGTIAITEVASGNIRLKEATGGTAASPTEVLSWVRVGSVDGVPFVTEKQIIPYAQSYSIRTAASSNIGEFVRIHRKQSFLNESTIEYEFFVDSLGANILNITSSTDASAHITYKKKYDSNFTETSTDVPAEFFDYILYTVLSDFYTGDGQTEKAVLAEQTATRMLDRELFKLDTLSNRNSITKRFSTYVNRQSR